jgi:hypothetical protein
MFKMRFGKVPDRWLINYAHVVVSNRLGTLNSPSIKITLELGIRSFLAALRWNHDITPAMKQTLLPWL